MKVVHVLRRIELIDDDIKELRKLEKTIARDKSFSTPIYMSIEKQINLLLGDRIKLLELQILNPPENYVNEIEGSPEERKVEPAKKPAQPKKKETVTKEKPAATAKPKNLDDSDDDIPMLTQDMIDNKFEDIQKTITKKNVPETNGSNVKILDMALEKSNAAAKNDSTPEKKVKFFRDNFPID